MVTQQELREYVTATCEMKKLEAVVDTLKDRFMAAKKANEEVEVGSLDLNVTIVDDCPATSWKKVAERVAELHPELAGAIKGIEIANTKTKDPYPLVTIKPVG